MMCLKRMSLKKKGKISKISLNFYQNKSKTLKLKSVFLKEKEVIFTQWLQATKRISHESYQFYNFYFYINENFIKK